MYQDGFNDPLSKLVMGETAEELAAEAGIDRAAADAYALESQLRCERARGAGRFDAEIVPVEVAGQKGETTVDARRAPARRHDPGRADQAGAGVPRGGRGHRRQRLGRSPTAPRRSWSPRAPRPGAGLRRGCRLVGWEVVGVDPRIMGIGPVPAVRKLLAKTGVDHGAIDEVELNEAFAAQVLACDQELRLRRDRLNPDGGAIALGHPIGATGARILVTLLHGMETRGGERGIATLCVSGGMGIAALVQREAA